MDLWNIYTSFIGGYGSMEIPRWNSGWDQTNTAPCGKMFVVLGEIAQGDPGDGENMGIAATWGI